MLLPPLHLCISARDRFNRDLAPPPFLEKFKAFCEIRKSIFNNDLQSLFSCNLLRFG